MMFVRSASLLRVSMMLSYSSNYDHTILVPLQVSATSKLAERDQREHLNLVFIGHVDAGKSTFCGQILYRTGQVDPPRLSPPLLLLPLSLPSPPLSPSLPCPPLPNSLPASASPSLYLPPTTH